MKSNFKIKLNDIPDEGRSYIFNNKSAELNEDLRDLIENNSYHVELTLRPLNNSDFSLTGTVKAQTKEICSLCGDSINFPIQTRLNEILIPMTQRKDDEKQSKSNHFSEMDENAPSVSEYKSDVFEMGSYIHESIAICVPFNPKPEITEKGDCRVCLTQVTTDFLQYNEDLGAAQKTNPFSALQGLKLKTSKTNNSN